MLSYLPWSNFAFIFWALMLYWAVFIIPKSEPFCVVVATKHIYTQSKSHLAFQHDASFQVY